MLDQVFEKVALSDRGAMGLLMVAPAIAGAYGGYEGARGTVIPTLPPSASVPAELAGGLTGIPLAPQLAGPLACRCRLQGGHPHRRIRRCC